MNHSDSFGCIGVFMGGNSSEREVSLRSGTAIVDALKAMKCDVVGIDLKETTYLNIRRLVTKNSLDMVFIAMHGRGGEDGTIQSFLSEMGIPYTGSSPAGSRLAFNKYESKKIFQLRKVPTPDYKLLRQGFEKKGDSVMPGFSFPVFVKPVEEGSSVGTYQVWNEEELNSRLFQLFHRYDQVLLEKAIEGRELTVGILGNEALPLIELKPKNSFYDFSAKYTKGLTEYLVPAPLSEFKTQHIQTIALSAHQALGLQDFSRVDIMMDERESPFVLEVNSIPGFTETSLLPKAAKEINLELGDLCMRILNLAYLRHPSGHHASDRRQITGLGLGPERFKSHGQES